VAVFAHRVQKMRKFGFRSQMDKKTANDTYNQQLGYKHYCSQSIPPMKPENFLPTAKPPTPERKKWL